MTRFAQNSTGLLPFTGILLALLGSVGCRMSNPDQDARLLPHDFHRTETVSGSVTTGGVFARSRSLAIPESGLTLGEAVEASLRPGLRQASFVMTQNTVAEATPPSRKGARLISSIELLRKFQELFAAVDRGEATPEDAKTAAESLVSDFHNDPETAQLAIRDFLLSDNASKIVTNLSGPASSDDNEVLLDRLLQVMKLPADQVAAPVPTEEPSAIELTFNGLDPTDAASFTRKNVESNFEQSVPEALSREAISAWIETHSEQFDTAVQRDSLLRRVQALAQVTPTDQAEEQPKTEKQDDLNAKNTAPKRSPSSLADQAVVVLKRGGDATRIMPLSLVQSTPMGDLMLTDGDRVQVNPFARTTVGSRAGRENQSGSVSLSGILSGNLDLASYQNLGDVSSLVQQQKLGPLVDVIVLGTLGQEGGVEEYWFPRAAATALTGRSRFDLSAVEISGADAIRATSIELSPMVRRSRLTQRIDQMDRERVSFLQEARDRKADVEQELRETANQNAFFQTLSRNLNRLSPLN